MSENKLNYPKWISTQFEALPPTDGMVIGLGRKWVELKKEYRKNEELGEIGLQITFVCISWFQGSFQELAENTHSLDKGCYILDIDPYKITDKEKWNRQKDYLCSIGLYSGDIEDAKKYIEEGSWEYNIDDIVKWTPLTSNPGDFYNLSSLTE